MKKTNLSTRFTLYTELLFTLLPIIIIAIVRVIQKDFISIFMSIEWSIIALILFGLSIVKFSAGISKSKKKFSWQFVGFILSLIIVLGLIPTSIIIVIKITRPFYDFWLNIYQLILFILSIVCFFIPGAVGQELLDE
jgi:hypothetical protein